MSEKYDFMIHSEIHEAKLHKAKVDLAAEGVNIEYAFRSNDLNSLLRAFHVDTVRVRARGYNITLGDSHKVYPICPTLFPSIESSILPPEYTSVYHSSSSQLTTLYSRFGQSAAIVSSPVADSLGLDCTNPNRSIFHVQLSDHFKSYHQLELQCIATATHMLGFDFTENTRTDKSAVLVNYESLYYLLEQEELEFNPDSDHDYSSYSSVFIHVKDSTPSSRAAAEHYLTTQVANIETGFVDLGNSKRDNDSREHKFYSMVVLVGALLLGLNVFVIIGVQWISCLEDAKDMGILLSLGTSKWTLIRTSLYQTLPPVLSGCIIGTGILLVLTWLAGHIAALLSDIPYVYSLPNGLMYTVPSLAILSALIAATLPKYYMLRQGIVDMLR